MVFHNKRAKMIDQEVIKRRSNELLRTLEVQINENLPILEDEGDLLPRKAGEVATRAIVLGYLLRFAFGQPAEDVLKSLEDFSLTSNLLNEERNLIQSKSPIRQEIVQATWQIEGVECLAWCLGLSEIHHLRECPETLASLFPKPTESPEKFIAEAQLRPFEELYQQSDVLYRLHWAVVNARLRGSRCPASESVVKERRRAIDWVIGVGPDWYEIPMST